ASQQPSSAASPARLVPTKFAARRTKSDCPPIARRQASEGGRSVLIAQNLQTFSRCRYADRSPTPATPARQTPVFRWISVGLRACLLHHVQRAVCLHSAERCRSQPALRRTDR